MNSLSIEEALAAINEAEQVRKPAGALTLEEWSETLGFGIKKTRRYLKQRIAEGVTEVNRVPIIDIAGRRNYTYVYANTE